jgi:hypothetical protein
MKTKEITRIGGITTISAAGNSCYISLLRSWNGNRVFVLLKEDFDKMRRQQERKNTQMVGNLAGALFSPGNQQRSCKRG